MAKVGGINVTISANAQRFVDQISRARRALGMFSSGVSGAIFSLKSLAAVAAGGVMVKLVSDQASAVDAMVDFSEATGVSTKRLAGFHLAAAESGVEIEQFNTALIRLAASIGKQAAGTAEGNKAFERLGLNVQMLARMAPDQQFLQLADAISRVQNKQEQLALATQIFGQRAGMMINVLRLGRGGLNEAAHAADRFGLAIDNSAAQGVARAVDAMGRLKMVLVGLMRTVAVEAAPYIEFLASRITGFIGTSGRGRDFARAAVHFMVNAVLRMADTGHMAFTQLLHFAAFGINTFNVLRAGAAAPPGARFLGITAPSNRDLELANSISNTAFDLQKNRNRPSALFNRAFGGSPNGRDARTQEQQLRALQDISRNTRNNVRLAGANF